MVYRFQSGFRYIGLFSEKTDIQPIADTDEGSLTRNSTTRKHTRSQYVEQIFRFKRIIESVLLHFFSNKFIAPVDYSHRKTERRRWLRNCDDRTTRITDVPAWKNANDYAVPVKFHYFSLFSTISIENIRSWHFAGIIRIS